MKSIIVFALTSIVLVSCNNNDGHFASEIQTVDSLQNNLHELKKKMESVDTSNFNKEYFEFKTTQTYLLENYPDSLNRNFWINDVNAMRRIEKAYGRFDASYSEVMEEIKVSEHKLETLRNSLEDEKLSEEEAKTYISNEMQAINGIKFMVYKVTPEFEASHIIWDSIGPGMNKLADSIRQLK